MAVAPISNYLSKRFGFRYAMGLGVALAVLGQIFAGLSTRIWQLFITQGVLFGSGIGFIFIAANPLLAQWFTRRRSLALGIAASGSGAGQLILSITTRLAIERISYRWAFIINGLITLAVQIPVVIALRSRASVQATARFEPLELSWFLHGGALCIFGWGVLSMLGYVIALFSLAIYTTQGLGLSQAQGSTVQAVLAAGQMIGRPICGYLLDRFGRIYMTSLLSIIAGLSCLVIWMFAHSYNVTIFFAFVQGFVGGVVWGAAAPVCAEICGVKHLGSVLGLLWLTFAPPALVAEPVVSLLINYSRETLGRQGPDTFLIAIGFASGCFVASGLVLLGAKRREQWKENV